MPQLFRKFIHLVLYQNDHEMINNRFKKSQDYYIIQVLFATAFSTFTGGVFLSGFAVQLGASDQLIGYLGLIPSICGVFLIFSSFLLERFQRRKRLVINFTLASKLLICSIVLVPLYMTKQLQITTVVFALVAGYTLQAITGVAINNWFISIVPENIRGRYFALRQTFSLSATLVLPILAGWFMDSVKVKYTGFLILFGMAAASILGEVFAYSRIEEPVANNLGKGAVKLKDVFGVPVKNKGFLYYTMFIFFLNIALYTSCNFTQVYMIRYLKLSYTLITSISMLNAALQIFFYRVWGRISDIYGHDFVVRTAVWFFAGELFFWTIMAKESLYFIPIAVVFSSIANSGFGVGAFNWRYDLMPEKGRSMYDGFFSAITGISLMVSPLIGGLIKGQIASYQFLQQHVEFAEFRLLYGISVLSVIVLQVFDMIKRRKKYSLNGSGQQCILDVSENK